MVAPSISATPLPSAARNRRRSRHSTSTPNPISDSPLRHVSNETPGKLSFKDFTDPPTSGFANRDRFVTPCRPGYHTYDGLSPVFGEDDLPEMEQEAEQSLIRRGTDLDRTTAEQLQQDLVAQNDVTDTNDDIEYMPPRAQGPSAYLSCFSSG
jgi:hypothetical protein